MNYHFPTTKGVSIVSDNKKVLSCINELGQKKLKSYQSKNFLQKCAFPFLRGLIYFFYGFYLFFISIIENNRLFETKKNKKRKKWYFYLFFASGCSFLIVFSLFFIEFLSAKLAYSITGNVFLGNFLATIFKLLFLSVLLIFFKFIPKINDMFRFNFAIEKTLKRSKRNLSAPNFFNFVLLVFFLYEIVITLSGTNFGIFFDILFDVSIFLVCASLLYEVLLLDTGRFCLMFFFVFSKPSKTHMEVTAVAQLEMSFLQKGREFMDNEKERAFSIVLTEVKDKLSAAGINDKSDAEWIVATVLGKSRSEAKLVPFVTEKQYKEIIKATERRANGESVDSIFGFTEFFGMRFDVNKNVLTPRMETEILVEQVLKAQNEYENCTILDLCTGSGAIAISLAKNCDAQVTGTDISKEALATATANAKKNGVKVEFLHSNLFDDLKRKRKFDIIVSNPPYIPTSEIEKLDKNVRNCDPILALDGGEDGLDFYRAIISLARKRLNENGQIFFEIGKGQASAVRKLLRENGYQNIKTVKDYNKIERIVSGKL